MLQRAASNAYSWWWASHIRTRQSKWLEQNLQDVEDKVKYILKIIDEDADSFAKRAEMYYRKRPELINFVEETYRAYRALAERYDHISGELQNANNTIATVFPGQVHFGIEEEDEEEGTPERKIPTTAAATKIPKNVPDISKLTLKVPKSNKKVNVPSKQVETEKAMDSNPCKEEASEKIDKLQKSILILQTEKEFMKSSYETALAKFWEIEKQITERQKKVCNLQDEHSVETVIEDDEARALMAATALKSCGDTLAQLQEQHMKSTEAARIESKKIMVAEEKLRSLKGETLPPEVNNDNNTCEARVSNSCRKYLEEDVKILNEGRMELESICQKVKQYLKMKSDDTFSVTVLAEMIDELVNKVLTLETAVSSQTALLERLRTETDELQRHLQALEEEKASVVDDSNSLTEKIKEMEEDLHEIHNLSLSVKDQNNQIRTHFNDACRNLDDLSEKLHSPQKKDTIETSPLEQEKQETILICHDELLNSQTELNGHLVEEVNKSAQEDVPASPKTTTEAPEEAADKPSDVSLPDEEVHVHVKQNIVEESPRELENKEETVQEKVPSNTAAKLGIGPNVEVPDAVDDSLWQQLLLNGLDKREKILLTEYTSILRNYKDTKKRLSEVEKKNQETMFQTMAQVRELKSSNAMKDLEIRLLKQKLGVLNTFSDENSDTQLIEIRKSHPSRLGSKLQISRSAVPNFFSNTPSQVDESVQNAQLNGKSDKVEEPTPDQEEIMVDLVNEPNMDLTVEEKFRRDIDELLEVNLEFWLRFSNSFHQIQKFHAAIQELKSHISKIKESKKQAGSSSRSAHPSPQLEVARIDKSLRELQSQLSDWLDQSALHREELQCRLLSLSRMQDEIARVLDMGSDLDQAEFTAYQAAKFQGEVLNIQQENTTVHEELQAGVDYVRSLHAEIEKILSKLNEKFNESSPRNSHHHHHFHHLQSVKHSMSRTKIPLRSFLFGAKPKKSKQSILACMTPSLQLQKQHSDMNAARKVPM